MSDNKKNNEEKIEGIIFEPERKAHEEKIQPAKTLDSGITAIVAPKKSGRMSLILVFILLLVSIIQSVELFSLHSQIAKGQFAPGGTATSASGAGQNLPSQQGGC